MYETVGNNTQMTISKSKIYTIVIFITLFSFDWFVMKPRIKEKYLNQDVWNFEKYSWKYSLIAFGLIYLGFVVLKKIKSKNSNGNSVISYVYLLFSIALLGFFFNGLTERTTLYLNSLYNKKTIEKEYIIQRYDNNGIFQLYDEKDEVIASTSELDRINSKRKSKNLIPIYDLKNNEKIIVEYQIGFLNTKYFE